MPMQGNGRVSVPPAVGLLAVGAWLCGAGCWTIPEPKESLCRRLQSNEHDVLVAAIVEAGTKRDRHAAPHLIDRLEHEAADVRLFSNESLRRITEKDFAYRAYAPEADRRKAVERWRRWLDGAPPAAGGEGKGNGG